MVSMTSRPEQLRERSKQFALAVMKLCREVPRTEEGRILGRQLLRSATSFHTPRNSLNRPIAK